MIKFAGVFALLFATAFAIDTFEIAFDHEVSSYDFHANHQSDMDLFEEFKNKHNKAYESKEEEMKRFNIFRKNLIKIRVLNKMEAGTAVYGINELTDLENDEFKRIYTGFNKDAKKDQLTGPFSEPEFDRQAKLSANVDWREKGAVTEVKNQAQCGSCWAFSAVGAIESQNKIVNNELISLSEQELVDCDPKSHGCSGGLMSFAFEAIMKLGGLESEADYPYQGHDGKCAFKKELAKVQVASYVNLTQNEDDIAKYVEQKGPVSVAINANLLQFYKGGIIKPNFVTKRLCNPKALNHGVIAVGFGEEQVKGKNEPFWVIRNSWSASFGEKGYFRITRGSNACGVAEMVSAPVVVKK